ncbi:MAG: transcription elongation factor GreA [Planctomycetota bacterium]
MANVPVTVEGKRKLQQELATLEARVPAIRQAIAEAREKGDLRENAEYHSAREELAHVQGTIGELRNKVANAVVIDSSRIDKDTVAFGATIELEDLSDGEIETWSLVGEGEDDPLENRILTSSPMGQALIGHREGDEVAVQAPVGVLRYRIKSISYA